MSGPAARALAAITVLLVAACGPEEPVTGPPEIRYGDALCARCGMSVDDPRFAAAIRFSGSDGSPGAGVYDDVGELFVALAAAKGLTLKEVWVHDAASEAWIDGMRAFYVRGEIVSPMGTGVEAYGDGEAARLRAKEVRGAVLDFNALLAAARAGDLG